MPQEGQARARILPSNPFNPKSLRGSASFQKFERPLLAESGHPVGERPVAAVVMSNFGSGPTSWARPGGGSVQFKVEYLSRPKPSPYVIVRQLETGSFALGLNPALEGIPIDRRVSQPRALRPDGTPDLAVFVFELVHRADLAKLTVGQVVNLTG